MRTGISEAGRELAAAAVTEDGAGSRQEWGPILESELAKARELQVDHPGLRHRELEQAVIATFLHSQPIGQKALTRDLLVLLGHTRPDRIELEKGLRRWTEVSWFLDESAVAGEGGASPPAGLPRSWRLGSKPNLRQMHHEACTRVTQMVDPTLLQEMGDCKALTSGASASGGGYTRCPKAPARWRTTASSISPSSGRPLSPSPASRAPRQSAT